VSFASEAFVTIYFLLLLLGTQQIFFLLALVDNNFGKAGRFFVPIAGIGVSNRRTPWFRRILELDITARTATESIAHIERSSVSKRAKSIASSERLRQSGQSRASAKIT
jgi:hypothetical protein